MSNKQQPRGLRNNNPGNIEISKRNPWQGEILPSQDKRFAQFKDMAHGYRALIKLLQNYHKLHGCRTLADYINRWAPSHENNTSAYINAVARDLQVPSMHIVNVNDMATMCALAAAISKHENGVPAVMADVHNGWRLLN